MVVRGLAELCGVATPTYDKILTWCQKVLGKQYLVDGKVAGNNVNETFAPQRFGFERLEDIPEIGG